jgi:hypothetical protein
LRAEVDRDFTLEGGEVDRLWLGEVESGLRCGVEEDGVDPWVSLECAGAKSVLFAMMGLLDSPVDERGNLVELLDVECNTRGFLAAV